MNLPSWIGINQKLKEGGHLDPLEAFIYNNEPAGTEAEDEFRLQLSAALDFASDAEVKP